MFTVVCLVRSTYGRGFIATHDDEIAAEAVGLNTTRYKIVAFVVGAFFAGVAGGLYGHFKLTITPTGFDFTKSIEIVVMVILGGMGNTPGVILAAILLTILPEVLRSVEQYRMVLYALLLIVLMLVRPKGLFNFDYAAIASRLRRGPGRAPLARPGRPMAEPILQLDKATIRFGGLTAVNALDLAVDDGDLVGLIGPNGAGKTTVFNLVTGVYRPTSGTRALRAARDLAGLKANEVVERGHRADLPEHPALQEPVGLRQRPGGVQPPQDAAAPAQALVRMRAFREDEAAIARRVEELLDLFNLRRFRDAPATSLPYGEQRRLEIVRCLATRPRLLLLDEPAAGMNPSEKVELMAPDPADPQGVQPLDPPRRALHEGRHGRLPADRRPRLRRQDRRGHRPPRSRATRR